MFKIVKKKTGLVVGGILHSSIIYSRKKLYPYNSMITTIILWMIIHRHSRCQRNNPSYHILALLVYQLMEDGCWDGSVQLCVQYCMCDSIVSFLVHGRPIESPQNSTCKLNEKCKATFLSESIEWFIEEFDLAQRPSLPSVSSTGDTQEDWERETTCSRERGRGLTWSQIIRPRESQVIYKIIQYSLFPWHFFLSLSFIYSKYSNPE